MSWEQSRGSRDIGRGSMTLSGNIEKKKGHMYDRFLLLFQLSSVNFTVPSQLLFEELIRLN